MKSKYSYNPEGYRALANDPTSFYMDPFQIFGNLYFVGNKNSSCHLIDTGDGLILFDTSYSNMAGQLIHSIYEMGFSPKDIKLIMHTHGHFDHFGATVFLTRICNAKTAIGEIDAIMMKERPQYMLCDYFLGIPTEVFIPDILLKDGENITVGNTTITAVHTPGHTQGVMTYLFDVTDGTTTHSAVLCGGTGFNSLNKDFINATGENYRPEFENSLKKWRGISADIYLGNHADQYQVFEKRQKMLETGTNPFIYREAWPAFLDELEQRYRKMLEVEG